MIGIVIVIFACLPAILAQTHADKCPGIRSAFNVNIYGCINMPCSFARGESATTQLYFFPLKWTTKLTPKVWLTLPDGTMVEYVLPENVQDGCKTLAFGKCPLYPFLPVIYEISLIVDPNTPPTAVRTQITLYDQHDKPVVCNAVDMILT